MSPMPDTPPLQQRRLRQLILAGGLVLVVAFSYGSGMRSQKKKLEVQGETLREVKQNLRVAELGLQSRDAQLQQWEARRQVALALQALDERNFGVARQCLDVAAGRLEAAERVGAANAAGLGSEAPSLRALTVEVSADSGATRTELLGILKRFDAALEKVVPAPGDVARLTVPPPSLNDVPKLPGPEIGR